MNKAMEKSYKISRVILAVMTFIIFNIIIINEDESWSIIPFIFAPIVFGLTFPSSVISRKLINIGNKLKSKLIKILYYVIALPIVSFLFFLGIYRFMYFISQPGTLGQALIILFWIAVGAICVVLPYIQTLIVLILNYFLEN